MIKDETHWILHEHRGTYAHPFANSKYSCNLFAGTRYVVQRKFKDVNGGISIRDQRTRDGMLVNLGVHVSRRVKVISTAIYDAKVN